MNEYIRRLSEHAKCAIRSYTDTQSTTMNLSLISRAGLAEEFLKDFEPSEWERVAILLSAIYNAPLVETITLYQFYKPNYEDYLIDKDLLLKKVVRERKGYRDIIGTYFQSTTKNPEVLKYLSPFHDNGCCFREINVSNMPILDLSNLSSYEFQEEVVLPPYIIFRQMRQGIKILSEHPAEDIKRCTLKLRNETYRHCKDGGDAQYMLDESCMAESQLKGSTLVMAQDAVSPYCISPDFIEYINKKLEDLYSHERCKKSNHGKAHISHVIILTLILYSSFFSNRTESFDDDTLQIALLSALLHDSGRECQNGIDIWESESADIARKHLPKPISDIVAAIIIQKDINESTHNYTAAYVAYKGADSVAIAKAKTFIPEMNPAYKTSSKLTDILIEKLSEEYSVDFGNIIDSIEHGEIPDEYDEEDMFEKEGNFKRDGFVQYNYGIMTMFSNSRKSIRITKRDVDKKMEEEEMSRKDALRELKDDAVNTIATFFRTIRSAIMYFISKRYLQDDSRYFHDYLEILMFFLPYMPYTMTGLSNFIIPFKHRDLFR